MKYTISKANSDQIEDIYAIEEQTWLSTYPNYNYNISRKDIDERFNDTFKTKIKADIKKEMAEGHTYQVIKAGTNFVGYMHLLKTPKYNDLLELYILQEWQHKGLGNAMIKEAFQWFEHNKPIILEVASYNQPAINFYQKHGFSLVTKMKQLPDEDWNLLPAGKRIPVIFMKKN